MSKRTLEYLKALADEGMLGATAGAVASRLIVDGIMDLIKRGHLQHIPVEPTRESN